MFESEPFTGPAETRDDLVCYEENIMFGADLSDQGEIIIRWNDDSSYAHHRFCDERCDRVRTLALDAFIECASCSLPYCFSRLKISLKSVRVWRWNVKKP